MFIMKWVGWISFFLVVIGLAVGGFFLASSFNRDTFLFKEVELLDPGTEQACEEEMTEFMYDNQKRKAQNKL